MKKQITIAAIALASAITASNAQADDIKVSGKVFFDYSKTSETGNVNARVVTVSLRFSY